MKCYFWEWLCDCYEDGSLDDAEIEECLKCRIKAYDLFIECWKMSKYRTGELVQKEIQRFKNHLDIQKILHKLEEEDA